MTDDSTEAGPERIRSIAVHREDVANALEATLRSDREVVLRVTPPYSGRMRARLHSLGTEDDSSAEPGETACSTAIHIDPRDLVADVPPYPEADETRADHPDADVETRRTRHAEAVGSWRERVRASIVASVPLSNGPGAEHVVDVTVLG